MDAPVAQLEELPTDWVKDWLPTDWVKDRLLCPTKIEELETKLGQTTPNHKYPHSEQKELMKCYYENKDKNPKICDKDIVKMFKIGTSTLGDQIVKRMHEHNHEPDPASIEAKKLNNYLCFAGNKHGCFGKNAPQNATRQMIEYIRRQANQVPHDSENVQVLELRETDKVYEGQNFLLAGTGTPMTQIV
uniref:Uncharacterized protein n=1 Tax=Globodera rostochiensis TaxID=31243 RepID=A0A914HRC4_GLORO